MARSLDLVVIGTGSAGSSIASSCRAAGWQVAVADERAYGGTCALRGCDPKKVLIEAARAVEAVRRLDGKGATGDPAIDWPTLIHFKRSFTDPTPDEREESLEEQGIEALHGHARFVGPTAIEVDGERYEARYVAIASGATPRPLPFAGADLVATSEEFMELDELPRRIVFVGGGFISFEFAHVAARAGAEVEILEALPAVLRPFDPDLVERLVERTRGVGIEVRTDTEVVAVESRGDGFVVRTGTADGEGQVHADLVVHGAGRVPAVEGLDLAAGEVEVTEDGGVAINGYLQSVSNPAVYAAGDVAGVGAPLTPTAAHHGQVVAANLLHGNTRRSDHAGIPAVAFTIPPLASTGMGEEEARESDLDIEVLEGDMASWASVRRVGETQAGYKILLEAESRQIVGAHLLGPGADETINLFALAIQRGLTLDQLDSARLAYPTHGSDIGYMFG